MELLRLIGILIVVVGFILKFDTIAVVVVAGIVTGLVAGMGPEQILTVLGNSFVNQRLATLFVLTLPVIGICERYGLKDKAVDLIRKAKMATSGGLVSLWLAIRSVAAAFSVRLGGHAQFIRPLIEPMANAASVARYDKLDEKTADRIKGLSASSENLGNFMAQNCFMGASGTLLIVSTLTEQGQKVDPLQIAKMSIPIAVIAVLVGIVYNWLFDRSLDGRYKYKKEGGK
ncbi:membrane protein [Spirochaetia bacterium]|nr:membrane protein [Spirochaetia bacterium]